MLIQPALYRSRFMDRVTVGNQKYFSLGLSRQSQQTAKKIQKHPRRETLTKNHEGQPPSIGDGRDHVAAKALTWCQTPLASARAVRRSVPLDGPNAAPSRLTNEFAP